MEHGAQSTQIQNYLFIWTIVRRRRHRPIEPRVFGQYYQLNEVTHLVEWVSFFEFGAGTFRFRSKTLKKRYIDCDKFHVWQKKNVCCLEPIDSFGARGSTAREWVKKKNNSFNTLNEIKLPIS